MRVLTKEKTSSPGETVTPFLQPCHRILPGTSCDTMPTMPGPSGSSWDGTKCFLKGGVHNMNRRSLLSSLGVSAAGSLAGFSAVT